MSTTQNYFPPALSDLIPTYILARGGKDLAAYRRALKSRKKYDKRFKVLLIGEDREALKGESFRDDDMRLVQIEYSFWSEILYRL